MAVSLLCLCYADERQMQCGSAGWVLRHLLEEGERRREQRRVDALLEQGAERLLLSGWAPGGNQSAAAPPSPAISAVP